MHGFCARKGGEEDLRKRGCSGPLYRRGRGKAKVDELRRGRQWVVVCQTRWSSIRRTLFFGSKKKEFSMDRLPEKKKDYISSYPPENVPEGRCSRCGGEQLEVCLLPRPC
ncbi:hypothetical protein CEXT_591541 [Caerostris extrusa]|uniref:Uncharacterized protein n=1 Tax=Caerostris extrusa TaxID=172846 RepID=A0AAV4WJQ1_CAEEX|nr:hypothetical protein CEXT_591541 [Caerostris extrusa]